MTTNTQRNRNRTARLARVHLICASTDSPKCDDERDSEMEHPFKNEIEIKGFPVPYTMHGGNCGHGGAGWGGDGFGGGFGGGPGWQRCGFHRPIKDMMT